MKLSLTKTLRLGLMGFGAMATMIGSQPAAAQGSDAFLGELMLFPYNFCPRGWAMADGSLLSISQNTALFSLLGTQYGGNGQTTFALPDMRGRVPVGAGSGPGLAPKINGDKAGSENVTLSISNMPAHSHSVQATNDQANKGGPGGKLLAADSEKFKYSDNAAAPIVSMNPSMIGATGGSQPFSVRDPYLVMQWCIALQGIFPSRN